MDRRRSDHIATVESARAAAIFAEDQAQYRRWQSQNRTAEKRGLTGDALEAAIMNIAAQFPDNVVRGVA